MARQRARRRAPTPSYMAGTRAASSREVGPLQLSLPRPGLPGVAKVRRADTRPDVGDELDRERGERQAALVANPAAADQRVDPRPARHLVDGHMAHPRHGWPVAPGHLPAPRVAVPHPPGAPAQLDAARWRLPPGPQAPGQPCRLPAPR